LGYKNEELLWDQTPDGRFKNPFLTMDAKAGA
jgi:hypothetical protein